MLIEDARIPLVGRIVKFAPLIFEMQMQVHPQRPMARVLLRFEYVTAPRQYRGSRSFPLVSPLFSASDLSVRCRLKRQHR